MAKQLVSPVERHLEKGVLGIAGVLLIGAIAMYGVSSPNKIEVGNELATPDGIDQRVAEKAESVRRRISTAPTEAEAVEPLAPELEVWLDAFARANIPRELPRSVPFGPPVPNIDSVPTRIGEKKLVEAVPPGKPVVVHGRSMIFVDEDGDRAEQVDWVTVSSLFDVKAQSEIQIDEYGPKRQGVIFGPVEMQRRMQRVDGTFSDDAWETIDPMPAEDLEKRPKLRLVESEDGKFDVNKAETGRLQQYLEKLREGEKQLALLRPMPFNMGAGDSWVLPINTSRQDVLMQDHVFNFPEEAREDPDDRYPDSPEIETVTTPQEEITPDMILEEAEKFLKRAGQTCNKQDAIKAQNRTLEVETHRNATRRHLIRAANIKKFASQKEDDILRGDCTPTGGAVEVSAEKEQLPRQQVWAHDMRPGSVLAGRTYQYRLRVNVYNRLVGEPRKFLKPEDALAVFVVSPWSEPCDPVTIEPAVHVYATNFDKRNEKIKVDIYKWFEGVWVHDNPKFVVGERVTKTKRKKVPSIYTVDEIDDALVTFDTGLTVVDIDFKRDHRERKRSRGGRSGVEFADRVKPECSVVFVDESGHLHERFVPTDKSNPEKNTIPVYKAPRP